MFIQEQGSPETDEDITLCPICLNVIFTNRSHGTADDPWTDEKIRKARGIV